MKIVEVLWDDACSASGWREAAELKNNVALSPCRTVGYILHKTSKFLSIVQSMGETNGYAADATTIPVSCIRKVRKLK